MVVSLYLLLRAVSSPSLTRSFQRLERPSRENTLREEEGAEGGGGGRGMGMLIKM